MKLPVEERLLQRLAHVPLDSVLAWRRWPFLLSRHPLWAPLSVATFACCGSVVKLFHKVGLSRSTLYGQEHLPLLEGDRNGRPLVTIANHVSTLDDPFMWGFLQLSHMVNLKRQRWTLIAEDICNQRLCHSLFFGLAQGIPVHRGAGVYQQGVDFAIEKLNAGGWVNVFPEGRVNQQGMGLPFKWGVGRIISDAKQTPLVLPIHIRGLEDVKHLHEKRIRFGAKFSVQLGEPLDLREDVLQLERDYGLNRVPIRRRLTTLLEQAMAQTKATHEAHLLRDSGLEQLQSAMGSPVSPASSQPQALPPLGPRPPTAPAVAGATGRGLLASLRALWRTPTV